MKEGSRNQRPENEAPYVGKTIDVEYNQPFGLPEELNLDPENKLYVSLLNDSDAIDAIKVDSINFNVQGSSTVTGSIDIWHIDPQSRLFKDFSSSNVLPDSGISYVMLFNALVDRNSDGEYPQPSFKVFDGTDYYTVPLEPNLYTDRGLPVHTKVELISEYWKLPDRTEKSIIYNEQDLRGISLALVDETHDLNDFKVFE